MGVEPKNRGWLLLPPKMDGENHGKPGGKPYENG